MNCTSSAPQRKRNNAKFFGRDLARMCAPRRLARKSRRSRVCAGELCPPSMIKSRGPRTAPAVWGSRRSSSMNCTSSAPQRKRNNAKFFGRDLARMCAPRRLARKSRRSRVCAGELCPPSMIKSRGPRTAPAVWGSRRSSSMNCTSSAPQRKRNHRCSQAPAGRRGLFYATWFLILRKKQQFAVLCEYCVKVLRQMTEKI